LELQSSGRASRSFRIRGFGQQHKIVSSSDGQLVFDDEPDRLERLARYLTRVPLGVDTVGTNDDGQVELSTPPQPSSADTVLQLNPLDWIHALCQQIPDRGQHRTRYYGAYANRTRKAVFQHKTTEYPPLWLRV